MAQTISLLRAPTWVLRFFGVTCFRGRRLGRDWPGLGAVLVACAQVVSTVRGQTPEPPVLAEAYSAQLGDAPAAPSPEVVAHLPRRDWAPQGLTLPVINTASRETVRNNFNAVYMASAVFSTGWTGDHARCAPGTTDAAFRDLVALRVNYYRAMAGLPAGITFADANNAKDQAAALIMSANNSLSHFPPASWSCYSADGYEAAGNSNIAIGNAGPDAVDAYMDDYGGNNAVVGHRRWILYPQTQIMGTGDVPATGAYGDANALWVFDGHFGGPRPATRDGFVAWPPPGFVPYPLVYARWSCGFPQANFSTATVTVSSNGVSVPVTLEPYGTGAGENTLVWHPTGMDPAGPVAWPRPAADVTFAVSVQGATVGGVSTNFSYTVKVFDPAAAGPDTVLPLPSGSATPAVAASNAYTFATVPGAASYEWRRATSASFTQTEGGESGLGDFDVRTSAGYDVLVTSPVASGQHAFHLAHPQPPVSQHLIYQRSIIPRTAAELRFRSRLGWASSSQVATVAVSTDGGVSWTALYEQAGTGGAGESAYSLRTVSLAAFKDRVVQFRFSYALGTGGFYPQTDPDVGWLIDDIAWLNADELTQPVVNLAGPSGFNFVPAAAGSYALQVRGILYDQFPLEWGPVTVVTAVTASAPAQLQVPVIAGGNLELNWTGGVGPFYIERKNALTDTAWQQVAGPISGNATSLSISGAEGFVRVRGQ